MSSKMTLLCPLVSIIISIVSSQYLLVEDVDFQEDSCIVSYNATEGSSSNCIPAEKSAIFDGDAGTSFEMSDHSWLDMNLEFISSLYTLTYLDFAWHNHSSPPNVVNLTIRNEQTGEMKEYDNYTINNAIGSSFDYYQIIWDNSELQDVVAQFVSLYVSWDNDTDSGYIYPTRLRMQGAPTTLKPTSEPTSDPTTDPTNEPTADPTVEPTDDPTADPSTDPTWAPTYSPTAYRVRSKTVRVVDGLLNDSYQFYSDNIIPLSDRKDEDGKDMTLSNFQLPWTWRYNDAGEQFVVAGEDRKYCLTCILAWADIDASLELTGCDDYYLNETDAMANNSYYHCPTGTWILKSSARLAEWQETYGRFEIWEVDDDGLKYRHWRQEFNWWNKTCVFDEYDPETGNLTECDVLPLTGTTEYAAYIEFSMPHSQYDVRTAPLIVVWYDVLAVPYSIAPVLNYEYVNYTIMVINEGTEFGLSDVWGQFKPAIIGIFILLGCFLVVMCLSCFVSSDHKSRKDYMIDTRNLRTTFKHTPETLMAPGKEIDSRSNFNCTRHGPWLLVVLVARLIYMFVFTFTFFLLMFTVINDTHFNTLDEYNSFAKDRDGQFTTFSSMIESWYANESNRMEQEIEYKTFACYDLYINVTEIQFTNGSTNQFVYHTKQMEDPLAFVKFNFSDLGDLFVEGDGKTACSLVAADGAFVLRRDPLTVSAVSYNVTYNAASGNISDTLNITYTETITIQLNATNYNTSWANFSELEYYLNDYCLNSDWGCVGWTFYDKTSTWNTQTFYLFKEMADPSIPDDEEDQNSGVCYSQTTLSDELYILTLNPKFVYNYTDVLNANYLEDFQSYADDMYTTVSGLWSIVQDLDGTYEDDNKYAVLDYEINDDGSDDYELSDVGWNPGSGADFYEGTMTADMTMQINCPDCPEGNFTQYFLEQAANYTYLANNISQYTNKSSFPVNVSNLVEFDTELVEIPELPTIEVPFSVDFDVDFGIVFAMTVTLDMILFIYRWYRTTGIVARIVRGKDVDVQLSYLMVIAYKPKCCKYKARNIFDYCLNCIIYCHDQLTYLSYNLWKVFYWCWFLLQLAMIAMFIVIMYYIVDQILTVKFISGLGAFDLMTAGLAAQRAVRNQVLGAAALSYNNYTLANIENAIEDYSALRNEDAWQQNIDELERVDRWNSLFCSGWSAYQLTSRDTSTESTAQMWRNAIDTPSLTSGSNAGTYFKYSTTSSNGLSGFDTAGINNLFDGNASSSWVPYNFTSAVNGETQTDVTISFWLSEIFMKSDLWVGWELTQIDFNWKYNSNEFVQNITNVSTIYYDVVLERKDNGTWYTVPFESGDNSWSPSDKSSDDDSFIEAVTLPGDPLPDTTRFNITFLNVGIWGTSFKLNELTIYGHAPTDEIQCPLVEFRFWDFDTSNTYIRQCPSITPVHGLMFRGFVRTWMSEQLRLAHEPFILAVRNIGLSPFYLLILGIGVLFIAYLFAFIMEWFLMKLDLYRENPYARVPLVTTGWDRYDREAHETSQLGTIYGAPTMSPDYYNHEDQDGGGGGTLEMMAKTNIEDHLTNQVSVRASQAPAQFAAPPDPQNPVGEDQEYSYENDSDAQEM